MTNFVAQGNIEEHHEHHIVMVFGRKKDNPELRKSTVCYYQDIVRNDILIERIPLYKLIAKELKGRLYVSVNPIDFKKARFDLLKRLVDSVESNTHNNILGQLVSSCMRSPRKDKKRYMLDIDTKDLDVLKEINFKLNKYWESLDKPWFCHKLETKNGWHYIVPPFDIRILQEFTDVEVKKNGMTVIEYMED